MTEAVNPNKNLFRQLRRGTTPTVPAKVVENAMAASAMSISTGDHPALDSAVIQQAPVVSATPQVRVVTKSRFSALPGVRTTTRSTPQEQPEAADLVGPEENVFPLRSALQADPEPSRSAKAAPATSRFGGLVDHESIDKAARINMSAAKSLVPLVAAISFKPGSMSEPSMRSNALAKLIAQVQKASMDVILAMGPEANRGEWARGQMMQVMSGIVAKQWEQYGFVNVEDIGRCMSGTLKAPSEEVQSALDSFANADKYVEATGPEIAHARLSTTLSSTAWEIYEWVNHPSLVQKSVHDIETPSRVFSYSLPVETVVSAILARVVDETRAFELQTRNQDLKLAHMQGSLRRMAQIAGAEYVTQTSLIHAWINDAQAEAEREIRVNAANEQFSTHVLPRVMEWARFNFAAVERTAKSIMDDYNSELPHENNAQIPR